MRTALPLAAAAVLFAATLPSASAFAQSFDDRWSIVPKAHADPAPRPQRSEISPLRAAPADPDDEISRSFNQAGHPAPNRVITGRASFYSYRKGKTASGTPFQRNALTAAHRTLPFGTRLRVTDQKTNKSVEVVVTDRGPAMRNRILDLSEGAAQVLGIGDRGVVQVRAEVLGRDWSSGS
jgi:rare lipoprotein A